MNDRELYSINEARHLLGGIARNTIYGILASGELASLTLGTRRFIPASAISKFIAKATTTDSPSAHAVRDIRPMRTKAHRVTARRKNRPSSRLAA